MKHLVIHNPFIVFGIFSGLPKKLRIERESHNHTVYGFLNRILTLTCTVIHGIPEGTLQWIVNNKTMNEGKTPLTYMITELQMKDHMKNFTCVVSNNFTKYIFEQTVQLFVYSKYDRYQHNFIQFKILYTIYLKHLTQKNKMKINYINKTICVHNKIKYFRSPMSSKIL